MSIEYIVRFVKSMGNNIRLQDLLSAYLNKDLSESDNNELLSYFYNPLFIKEIEERLGHEFDSESGVEDLTEEQQLRILNKVFEEQAQFISPIKKISLWPWVACAIAIVLICGIWFYNVTGVSLIKENKFVYNDDALPGRAGAEITLADGSVIKLDGGKGGIILQKGRLRYNDGTSLSSDPVETSGNIIASTLKGQMYRFLLPDGSKVWLNANSALSLYLDAFGKYKRVVELKGEAYFEIAKNKNVPFVVESKEQRVEVLGTHFNINSYSDEPVVTTTLLEGSVRLVTKRQELILEPGEQALATDKVVEVTHVNVSKSVDWIAGDFNFEDVDFRVVMREIGRWYDMEIVYDQSVSKDIRSGGWISRSNTLSSVLRSIEKSGQVHFKIEGKKIYVTK